ncbi:carbon-nitrogen hydrolase family protein [Streptomyces aureus]|uniref:Carbon-nitrogen hydrolase family protein n=1 Tax=Streptomyces aureus TaxID=193461 RepID=A0ABV4T1N3_9ACTN
MSLPVAVAQFAALADKRHNRAAITGLVASAAAGGARLVVLPENSMWSHPDTSVDPFTASENLDGEFTAFLADLAREHTVWLVCGMTERTEALGKVHNTLVVFDDTGKLVTRYRKVHLYDAFGYHESDFVAPGPISEPATFELDGFRFGILTCYELRFPESARRLAVAGADALVLPAAWVAGPMKEDHWITLLRARAIENTVYMIAADQTGPTCIGQSTVIDPGGVIVTGAGPAPGRAEALLDLDRIAAVRETTPSLSQRRFEVVAR